VTVIQGELDRLVPAENADFARSRLVNATVDMVRKDDLNHFIPWTKPQLIREAVDRHLAWLTSESPVQNLGQ